MQQDVVRNIISKVAFTVVGINERFDLKASKEIVETCYWMLIFRKKKLGEKMLKTTIKVTFNIENRSVEPILCLS